MFCDFCLPCAAPSCPSSLLLPCWPSFPPCPPSLFARWLTIACALAARSTTSTLLGPLLPLVRAMDVHSDRIRRRTKVQSTEQTKVANKSGSRADACCAASSVHHSLTYSLTQSVSQSDGQSTTTTIFHFYFHRYPLPHSPFQSACTPCTSCPQSYLDPSRLTTKRQRTRAIALLHFCFRCKSSFKLNPDHCVAPNSRSRTGPAFALKALRTPKRKRISTHPGTAH